MSDSAHRQEPKNPSPDGYAPMPATMTRRERREAAGDIPAQRLTPLPFLIAGIALIVVTGLTLWWFMWRPGSGADLSQQWVDDPGPGGIHARDVPPEDWETGYCLTNFEDEQSPADVIDCEGEYDTQLLLRTQLEGDSYPGAEDVASQAERVCEEDVELSQEAVDESGEDLALHQWYPTESTWDQGDRRVDCMLARDDEEPISGDFLGTDEDSEDEASEDEDSEASPEEDGGQDENSDEDSIDPSEGTDDEQ